MFTIQRNGRVEEVGWPVDSIWWHPALNLCNTEWDLMVYWLPNQITSNKDKKRVQEQQDAGWLPWVKRRPLTISVTPAKYGCNWCAPLEMSGPFHINIMPDGFKCHHFGKIQNFPC